MVAANIPTQVDNILCA